MRRAISLFSGIGGFDIAAEQNGFQIACQVEIDDYCNRVLEKHWPDVPRHRDIRTFDATKYFGIELLLGGPPCQGASIAGKRLGAADHRWLWPEAITAVERCQPAMCLFENPSGILTLNNGVEFERVLSSLESLGYSVQPIVVPACAVGARHRRNRVWIIAYSNQIGQQGGKQRLLQTQEPGHDSPHLHEIPLRHNRPGNDLSAPRIFRGTDGLSNGMDRIAAIGNAIVPAVASILIREMVKAYEQSSLSKLEN